MTTMPFVTIKFKIFFTVTKAGRYEVADDFFLNNLFNLGIHLKELASGVVTKRGVLMPLLC